MHLILKIFLTLACLLLSGLVYSDNSKHMSIDDECKLIGLKLASVTKDECLSAGLVETGYYSELGKAILVKEFPPLNISKPLGRILLLGGIHGDEYSSISIVFKWLQILNKHHSGSFHWRIAPFVNPDGLLQQEATRVNSNGVDLNRNFATLDWEKYAQEYWRIVTNSDYRKNPGKFPLSQSESKWVAQEIKEFDPDIIISIHAPLDLVDLDGPKNFIPLHIGHLEHKRLGNFPGSLGRYGWQNGIPVLTVELTSSGIMPSNIETIEMWEDIVAWLYTHLPIDLNTIYRNDISE